MRNDLVFSSADAAPPAARPGGDVMRCRVLLTLSAAALLALTGCGGSTPDGSAGGSSASSGQELTGTLTVFAAPSLTDVFTALGDRLQKGNPRLDGEVNFPGSPHLAPPNTQGGPADR